MRFSSVRNEGMTAAFDCIFSWTLRKPNRTFGEAEDSRVQRARAVETCRENKLIAAKPTWRPVSAGSIHYLTYASKWHRVRVSGWGMGIQSRLIN